MVSQSDKYERPEMTVEEITKEMLIQVVWGLVHHRLSEVADQLKHLFDSMSETERQMARSMVADIMEEAADGFLKSYRQGCL